MTDPGWQELRLDTHRESIEALEEFLFAHGAVAITLRDNADQPLLEPGPGETPIWDNVRVIALFPAGEPVEALRQQIPEHLVTRVADAVDTVPE